MRRRLARTLSFVVAGLALLGLMGWVLSDWWRQSDLGQARREIETHRFASARARLARLAAWWPRWDEVEFLLGVCEHEEGRPDAAAGAWARVSSHSPFAEKATLLRSQAAMDRGHLTEAEMILTTALEHPGPQAVELRQTLIQLLWNQARFDEVCTLIETNWRDLCRTSGPTAEMSIATLRGHLSLDLEMYTYDKTREGLERVSRVVQDDDRIWLALANLAIRTGRLDEATQRLRACLKKRPSDPVVWSTMLELALAAGAADQALAAVEHLTTEQVPLDQVPRLQAWFAARVHDAEAEQRFLDRALELDPYNTAALER